MIMNDLKEDRHIIEYYRLKEFLKTHQKVIKREMVIANAESIAAPMEVKNYFLEKYNLLKGLDYLLNEVDDKSRTSK